MVETLEDFEAKLASIDLEGESLTVDEERILAIEYHNCSVSFLRFLGYCKIEEPPVPGNPSVGGIIRLQQWPHILRMAAALLKHRLIIILKSRQIGASWLMAAYDLWWVKFHPSSNVFLYSKGEAEAWEKLDKCRRLERHLPAFLRHTVNPDSKSEMKFVAQNSTLRAFPATASAGIGFTASILDMDELEEHPYAEQNFAMAKPTIDAGGQYIGVFTVNKLNPVTLAKTLFTKAWYTPEDSAFKALFFDYSVRPGRDEAWYARTLSETPEEELGGLSPQLYMEQNYPRSVEEALSPTQTTAAFNLESLKAMLENIQSPIKVEVELDLSVVNIYKDFNIGDYYVAATDTSHGVGRDNAVTCIMNVKTGAVVADILRNDIPPEELAWHSVKLLDHYRKPKWFPEDNEWGKVTIVKAQELGYSNFGYSTPAMTLGGKMRTPKERTIGFHTDPKTRIELFGQLIPAINNRQIVIYNVDGLRQFFDVIRNVAKEGRIEAKPNRHDDYPITVGICWLKKNEVYTGNMSEPIRTLDFGNDSRPLPHERKELKTLTFR